MTLQQLRDFLAVVKHGSLRAAARALSVSQPGLTKSLQALEQSLGVPLLVRTPRGIALTTAGQELFARARILLREADKTEQAIAEFGQAQHGSIRFGVSTTPLLTLVPKVLGQFRQRRPGFALHFTTGLVTTLLPAIREGQLDFAIMPVKSTDELGDLQRTCIGISKPVIVGRKNHPLAKARTVLQLRDCDWVSIGPGHGSSDLEDSVSELFSAHGLGRPRAAVSTDSVMNCLPVLATTDCLAALPELVLSSGLVGGALVRIPIQEPLPRYGIHVVHRGDPPLEIAAAELARMFISLARVVDVHTP